MEQTEDDNSDVDNSATDGDTDSDVVNDSTEDVCNTDFFEPASQFPAEQASINIVPSAENEVVPTEAASTPDPLAISTYVPPAAQQVPGPPPPAAQQVPGPPPPAAQEAHAGPPPPAAQEAHAGPPPPTTPPPPPPPQTPPRNVPPSMTPPPASTTTLGNGSQVSGNVPGSSRYVSEQQLHNEEGNISDGDGFPDEEANLLSSSMVDKEIRNCHHQINVAIIALENLRKVSNTIFNTHLPVLRSK